MKALSLVLIVSISLLSCHTNTNSGENFDDIKVDTTSTYHSPKEVSAKELIKFADAKKTSEQTSTFLNFKIGMSEQAYRKADAKIRSQLVEYAPGVYAYKMQLDSNKNEFYATYDPEFHKNKLVSLSVVANDAFDNTRDLVDFFTAKYKTDPVWYSPEGTYKEYVWVDGNKFVFVNRVSDGNPNYSKPLAHGHINYVEIDYFTEKVNQKRREEQQEADKYKKEQADRINKTKKTL